MKAISRKELREGAVNKFLSEKGGYWKDGKKHVTMYRYNVETLKNGKRVFLLKPTFLNKGIDFQVWIEDFKGKDSARPSHKDIIEDLKLKKHENIEEFVELMKLINKVYDCTDPDDLRYNLDFKKGLSVELILKALKWLFIEQDITYWNYDGRGMLKGEIDKVAHS
ncbi:MAG: hypothetical protein KGH60_05130 [Candidatus Micrarchaeota archaeon]|nr:hypothetical protein [Candidatus Micrarchaeota archaeon]